MAAAATAYRPPAKVMRAAQRGRGAADGDPEGWRDTLIAFLFMVMSACVCVRAYVCRGNNTTTNLHHVFSASTQMRAHIFLLGVALGAFGVFNIKR